MDLLNAGLNNKSSGGYELMLSSGKTITSAPYSSFAFLISSIIFYIIVSISPTVKMSSPIMM